MKNFILAIAATGLLASGCAVHKSELPAGPPQTPAEYAEYDGIRTPAAPEAETAIKFWQGFGDDDLNRIIDATLTNNLDLAKSYARLEQLEAASRSSSAMRLPFVNLTGQAGRERQLTTMGSSTGNSARASLAAGYEIDLWQKVKNQADAASLTSQAAGQDLRTLYLSLTAQAADLYYLTVEQRAQLVLTDEIINSYQETLDRMESRYREGLVPALDVYQARQNILAAKSRRPQYEAGLAVASHGLDVLAGRFPEKSRLSGNSDLPDLTDDLVPVLPATLVTRRPDIRAAWLRLAARDATVAAAVADRFPSINLAAGIGSATLDFATSASGLVWNIMLSAAQPLYDGGRRRAEVDRTRALLHEEMANYQQTVLKAFQEVEDALVRSRTTAQRLELLKQRQAATEATLRLATDNYFEGVSDYLSVLTSQVIHYEVKSQLISARRELISDRITLARALGGDWMDKNIDNYSKNNTGK